MWPPTVDRPISGVPPSARADGDGLRNGQDRSLQGASVSAGADIIRLPGLLPLTSPRRWSKINQLEYLQGSPIL